MVWAVAFISGLSATEERRKVGPSAGLVGTMVKTLAYQSNGSEFESRCRLATPLSAGDLSPLGSDPDDFCGSRNGR